MNRENIVDKLAQNSTDNMDLVDLQDFFYWDQYKYYDSLSDAELQVEIEQLKEMGVDLNNVNTTNG